MDLTKIRYNLPLFSFSFFFSNKMIMNKREGEKEKEIEIRKIIFSLDIAFRCSSFSLKLYAGC